MDGLKVFDSLYFHYHLVFNNNIGYVVANKLAFIFDLNRFRGRV